MPPRHPLPPRCPADIGWDDGILWDDHDLAAYLRCESTGVAAVVAAGAPVVEVPGVGRRFDPGQVREWVFSRSSTPAPRAPSPSLPRTRRIGSGAPTVKP